MSRTSRKTHARLMCGAASAALLLWAGNASAESAAKVEIAPQPLASALNEFGVQTGRQVIFAPSLTGAKTTSGVSTDGDIELALARLLEGSGLTFRRDEDTFLIVQGGSGAPQSGSAAGAGAEVEALIVTAQKREEDIQDVPIAMSAFSQEQLETHQIAGGPDLMTQIPNMTFTKTNFSSYSIQIRGIGTQAISATTDPAVAVAFNNTPFVRNRFFEQEFYDLQRVEVLRGPQGTLYGRNATAGVVNIISAKPSFNYQAKLSGDVSNYNSTRLEGMVNMPLVDDVVALRLAGAWTRRDGFVTNEITGNPIDGRDLWSTRVSLRVSPNDRIDANLIWEHFEENDDRLRSGKQLCHQDDRTEINGFNVPRIDGGAVINYSNLFSQGCLPFSLYAAESFEAPDGFSLPYYAPTSLLGLPIRPFFDPYVSKVQSRDLRVIESTVDPEYWAKSDIVELQLSYDIADSLTLTSETAYNYDELFSKQDFNRFNTRRGAFLNPSEIPADSRMPGFMEEGPFGGIFCDPQVGCADRLVAVDLSTARSRQFSQEVRLGSDFDGPFNFSVGANYLRYDTEDKYYVFINTLTMTAVNTQNASSAPYVLGERRCLSYSAIEPDPNVVQFVGGCIYIDPNPIGALEDDGHNYFLSKNPYKLISYSAFGEMYYNITENLKATGGLRFTVDKKEAPRIPSWVLASNTAGYPVAEVLEQEWREPTGRLAIDWKPELGFTDETLLYASYARGYKAGGMNPPVSGKVGWSDIVVGQKLIEQSATKPKTFEAEFVDAFEFGAKNTLLDGRLTLNTAAFYYDYKGYQISQIIDRSATNYNFDAEVWGLEIEADWRPLENLKLGFKGGYENTRVGDGEQAIDIMDRTAGDPDWVVVRPFPSYSSNCILPTYVMALDGETLRPTYTSWSNGQMGPCEYAYQSGWDPQTKLPYVPDPTVASANLHGGPGFGTVPVDYGDYPGFNPLDASLGHNNGEGFFKDLSGNELPNAPHFTATITADYTVPLPSDWLMTLHTDLYYQSEAWTRIFNTEGYDKLKAYTNVNLAAIFTNEPGGWKVMAYVKNVFDRDSITGAFLFSDDVGLTTNVFLTEPRLYGLRVTKEWTGGAWWNNANHQPGEPYAFTLELGGSLARHDAPYDLVAPVSIAPPEGAPETDFVSDDLNPIFIQNQDLDMGEGGEVKLTWQPAGSPWKVSGGVRFGKAKGLDQQQGREIGDQGCTFGAPLYACPAANNRYTYAYDWSKSKVTNHEKHTIVDFEVGREVGLGGIDSTLKAGVRYAAFESRTRLEMYAVPDWDLPPEWVTAPDKYASHTLFRTDLTAEREFKGVGPTLTWDGASRLWGDDANGRLNVDWSLAGGVLFGKQKAHVEGQEEATYYGGAKYGEPSPVVTQFETPKPEPRSKSVTVPTFAAALGLSYEVQRFKVGAGYRWERYFDVLDTGFDEAKDADRTIDGPYFKIAVGFGG